MGLLPSLGGDALALAEAPSPGLLLGSRNQLARGSPGPLGLLGKRLVPPVIPAVWQPNSLSGVLVIDAQLRIGRNRRRDVGFPL
jgi:hypothetical protein